MNDIGAPKPRSFYLTMRDGVRIAVDLLLPTGMADASGIPTVMRATRYWRMTVGGDPDKQMREAAEYEGYSRAGYALVLIDVRGTGASFGTWTVPWSKTEVEDLGEFVDWIVGQPWSNGRVGAVGSSHSANTALAAAYSGRAAVKAVVGRFPDWDAYANLAFPGGIFNMAFVSAWVGGNIAQDAGRGRSGEEGRPKPVDADTDGALLRSAIASHASALQDRVPTFRDDTLAETGETLASVSPYAFKTELKCSDVPLYLWASWMDAGTAAGVLSCFETLRNAQQVVIGPWNHGATRNANPLLPRGQPLQPTVEEQRSEIIAFLDRHLRDGATRPERMIRYYTCGEEAWHTTDRWPPAGVTSERWYFAPDRLLEPCPPASDRGADEYAVDFEATTGINTRWHTQLAAGMEVVYSDRAKEDASLLVYTSAPQESDCEITGSPTAVLYVRATTSDCAIFAYLEEIDEDGRVSYITEGQLRALHRAVCPAPPYAVFGPYHSCERADAARLFPGELSEFAFALFPTSLVVRRGRRLRVAISGHDTNFARLPQDGAPVFTIGRTRHHPSHILLPVRKIPVLST